MSSFHDSHTKKKSIFALSMGIFKSLLSLPFDLLDHKQATKNNTSKTDVAPCQYKLAHIAICFIKQLKLFFFQLRVCSTAGQSHLFQLPSSAPSLVIRREAVREAPTKSAKKIVSVKKKRNKKITFLSSFRTPYQKL